MTDNQATDVFIWTLIALALAACVWQAVPIVRYLRVERAQDRARRERK